MLVHVAVFIQHASSHRRTVITWRRRRRRALTQPRAMTARRHSRHSRAAAAADLPEITARHSQGTSCVVFV